jgi:adenylate kinase
LRCHPKELRRRLSKKGWPKEKIEENAEAELLDIILGEALDILPEENVFEIDTTNKSFHAIASLIQEIISGKRENVKNFKKGKIDWIADL